jgi:hypothetical protein
MKTSASLRLISTAGVVTGLLTLWLGTARAQPLGDITSYVISPATENSIKVRVVGVNDWPVNPIGGYAATGLSADGTTYTWSAWLIGDGLVDPNDVNVAVAMGYADEGFWSISYNLECPHPATSFSQTVYFDGTNNLSVPNPRYSWYTNNFFLLHPIPSIIYKGTISLKDGKLTVDMTFIGGSPIVTVADVMRLVNDSSLSSERKKSLLKILAGARDAVTAGDCAKASKHLQTFKNKVRAQVKDAALADTLITSAQDVINGCH